MKKMILFTIIILCLSGCTTSNQEIVSETNNQQLEDEIIKDFDEVLGIGINSNIFPDKEFTKYIKNNIDVNKDNYLSFEEIDNTKSILLDNNDLSNLKGIEHFVNLEELKCIQCSNIDDLDLSHNIQIRTIELSKCNCLKTLNIINCKLLSELILDSIPIMQLDISNNFNIKNISIIDTNIEYLGVFSLKEDVNISGYTHNNIKIDISNCPYLKNNVYNVLNNIKIGRYVEQYEPEIDIISDNIIIIHSKGYDKYIYGCGNIDIINISFETYKEALDYGLQGNKWFKINSNLLIQNGCGLMSDDPNTDCPYQYEVIVYDEQPF